MSTTKHHYRSDTKRGFLPRELAAILNSHSPGADYRVVINLRGKVREVIVDEGNQLPAGRGELERQTLEEARRLAGPHCETPAAGQDDQAFGGKAEAAYHGRPWHASEDLDPDGRL